jgi:hypothetical protein
MLTLKSTLKDLIDLCTTRNACKEAQTWMAKELEKDKSITLDKLLAIYVDDVNAPEGWAAWNLEVNGKDFDSGVKDMFIAKIKNEMTACQVYIKCAPVLTTAQDTTLKAVYKGKLPIAEKELRDGIITRATAEVAP